MSTSPDAIRAEIEETHRELGGDVDALADKVSPSKIVERQKGKVKGAIGSVKDRIMGVADDAGSGLHGAGAGIGDAKDRVVAKAEGNPLAVGLIAFGVGLVVASLIPASQKEKDVAAGVQDSAQPLVDKAKDVAKEVGEHLKEPAQEAAAAVKDTATDAARSVTSETKDAAAEVKGQAQRARENISGS